MSHRDNCPDPWEARREGERAFDRGLSRYSSEYDCDEGDRSFRLGYSAAEERHAEQECERARQEQREHDRQMAEREEQRVLEEQHEQYLHDAYEQQCAAAYEAHAAEAAEAEQANDAPPPADGA